MLDSTDLRLLQALQRNAHVTAQELGDILHLSPSQAGRRRQRLEAENYVKGYVAQLNPALLGLNVQAFIQISMASHSSEPVDSFHTLMLRQPEVVSVWTMTGEADYLLRVWCADLAALNTLVHQIFLPHGAVQRVQTRIVMDQIKQDAPLPL